MLAMILHNITKIKFALPAHMYLQSGAYTRGMTPSQFRRMLDYVSLQVTDAEFKVLTVLPRKRICMVLFNFQWLSDNQKCH